MTRSICGALAAIAVTGCSIANVTFTTGGGHDDDDTHHDTDGSVPGDITIRTLDATGAPHAADLIGIHDGAGAWQVITGSDGVYHVHISSDQFGVALVCTPTTNGFAQVSVQELIPSDGAMVDMPSCPTATLPSMVTVTGTVTGLGGNDYAYVTSSSGSGVAVGSGDGTYSALMRKGPTDLFVDRRDLTSGVSSLVARRRGVTIDDGSMFSFDLSAEGKPVTQLAFSAPVAGSVSTGVVTPQGTYRIGVQGGTAVYASPPAGLLDPGDLVQLTWTGDNRANIKTVLGTEAVALDIAEPVSVPAPTPVVGAPYPAIAWALPVGATVLPHVSYLLLASSNDPLMMRTRSWQVTVSRGWATATHATTYTLPDLSALAGFSADDHALVPAEGASYSVFRSETTDALDVIGGEARYATQSGTVTF